VVWPTIRRPPAVGASYDGFNRALARAASRHPQLVLVDWVGMVRRHPTWLSRDGVHVSVEGYRARAAAIAAAVKTRCAP
jgi:lysophospholipase L1-like esterase